VHDSCKGPALAVASTHTPPSPPLLLGRGILSQPIHAAAFMSSGTSLLTVLEAEKTKVKATKLGVW
jgi:hypothetical protein